MSGLGRRPFVPDRRDFSANRLRTLIRSRQATPKSWTIDRILDQGTTPHCVGFGCADYGNALPVDDEYTDADGHALYYEACAIGGYPDTEDGANVRDGLKALRARGRIAAYALLHDAGEAEEWLSSSGSVVVGTDWYEGMDDTGGGAVVTPTGDIRGGHCYLLNGYTPTEYEFVNSWGTGWGSSGRFYMAKDDFAYLLRTGGEAWAAIELVPGPAPTPTRPSWLAWLWNRLWHWLS